MLKRWTRWIGTIGACCVWSLPAASMGQMTPVPPRPQGGVTPGAVLTNPYLNGSLNPYLNPGGAARPMSPADAALYLYAAQSANGGIGSGRLSGYGVPAQTPRAAEIPNSVARPGAGAARYFNPGPVNVNGAGRYYNRRNPHFSNNGR